jgi:hypothetical protein
MGSRRGTILSVRCAPPVLVAPSYDFYVWRAFGYRIRDVEYTVDVDGRFDRVDGFRLTVSRVAPAHADPGSLWDGQAGLPAPGRA